MSHFLQILFILFGTSGDGEQWLCLPSPNLYAFMCVLRAREREERWATVGYGKLVRRRVMARRRFPTRTGGDKQQWWPPFSPVSSSFNLGELLLSNSYISFLVSSAKGGRESDLDFHKQIKMKLRFKSWCVREVLDDWVRIVEFV